jgi:hypothetical protein
MAMLLAGCATSQMTATAPAGAMVSGMKLSVVGVQGPAPEIAQKFQAMLDEEARKRGFQTVASPAPPDALRVKAYLDAFPGADGKAGFSWVLDASGDGQTRAARVNGAAASGAPATAAWSALDDAALRQIASASVGDLARTLSGQPAATAAETAEETQ